ncbi:MAG: signal peptide peptidase SppA [Methanomicrobiales archaeon]|nr:signal peptide peptidase SppA [Methanomicrobiales archaeon]
MGFLEEHIQSLEKKRRRKERYPLLAVILIASVVIAALFAIGWYSRERNVVVIPIEGELYTGAYSGGGVSGSEQVGKEIRSAADDALVEAIVLRVDSPGGSPAAAQEIIQDLQYARSKKPVVVSIGDLATSAAYYISAYADRIYANPDSITGGIGTVWIFTDISEWMQKEGYAITVVKSGENKDMTYPYRTLSPDEERYAQDIVDRSFERFVTDVTVQRNISRNLIEDGRLYRGEEAKTMGLVDEMGNLQAAIEGARYLASR